MQSNSSAPPEPTLATMGRQKSIFPQKLWQMINNPNYRQAISWSDDGHSFCVFEPALKTICLGKENNIFHTRQPKSFVRQLHLYGFRKIGKNQFVHPCFRRDQPDWVQHIKRPYKPEDTANHRQDGQPQLPPPAPPSSPNDSVELQTSTCDELDASVAGNMLYTNLNVNISSAKSETQNGNQETHQAHQLPIITLMPVMPLQPLDQQEQHQELALPKGELQSEQQVHQSATVPQTWYDCSSCVEISFDLNEDAVLTLYNNDIYPNNVVHM